MALIDDYSAGIGISPQSVSPPPLAWPAGDESGLLAATLPVRWLALGAVMAFVVAGNRFRDAKSLPRQPNRLRIDRIAASFSSDRMMRVDGSPISGFAELSGFFEAADGWVRTHANYPHHRARLLAALELPTDADRTATAERVALLEAAEIEERAAAADAIAVRVRAESEWAASEPGRAAATGPIVSLTARADTARAAGDPTLTCKRPLIDVRVLDLTRVIAGPVATRALALLGADVLRIDSPDLPEISWQHLDTGQGKRSALLDIVRDRDRALELASEADVLVTGYRPGALDDFAAEAVAVRPGLVRARVSAWGEAGPWAHRRGFDSIVQAASGIALIEGTDRPGALPAQALDHATGYLLAAGILDALTARGADGRGRDVVAALARTGAWLLDAPGRDPAHPAATLPSETLLASNGAVRTAPPALGEYDDYPAPAQPWGSDEPAWRTVA